MSVLSRALYLPLAAVLVGSAVPDGSACQASLTLSASSERSVVASRPDTLISTDDATIGGIADLLVVPNGSVYLTDRMANGIHVVDSAGRFVRTIGRQGQGPGEFSWPAGLEYARDTLAVADTRNGRIQFLTLDGTVLGTTRLPRSPTPSTRIGPGWVTLSPTSGGYFPALGIESGELIVVRAADETVRARLGRAECVTPNPVRMSEMRREIAEGGIPCILRNSADAWAGDDGSLWMMLPTQGRLARFDARGTPVWEMEVQDPAFPAIYERFVSDNAAAEPMVMPPLEYLLDAKPIGPDLWVLMGQSKHGPAVIRVIRANGSAGPELTFPGVVGAQLFAVDTARRRIYFVRPEAADLLRSRF